jgi:phenylpyruvate tautomerase
MPCLKIQTNAPMDAMTGRKLIGAASQLLAAQLGKPERYVMVILEPVTQMLFAGDDAPLAYLELKSIGLPKQLTADLSKSLCGLLHHIMNIPNNRIYIEFSDVEPGMWGWNGETF